MKTITLLNVLLLTFLSYYIWHSTKLLQVTKSRNQVVRGNPSLFVPGFSETRATILAFSLVFGVKTWRPLCFIWNREPIRDSFIETGGWKTLCFNNTMTERPRVSMNTVMEFQVVIPKNSWIPPKSSPEFQRISDKKNTKIW